MRMDLNETAGRYERAWQLLEQMHQLHQMGVEIADTLAERMSKGEGVFVLSAACYHLARRDPEPEQAVRQAIRELRGIAGRHGLAATTAAITALMAASGLSEMGLDLAGSPEFLELMRAMRAKADEAGT
jgi:hypothetical protein